jgi:hypothetical protein
MTRRLHCPAKNLTDASKRRAAPGEPKEQLYTAFEKVASIGMSLNNGIADG